MDRSQIVKCFDKFGEELQEGDYVDVQTSGKHKIYKKEDGQLYFKPYGREDRVSDYFSDDMIKCDDDTVKPGGKDGWVKQDTLKNLENISSKNIDPEFVDIVNDSSEKTLEEVADKLSDELHAVFEMNNEDAFLWILNILNKGATWQAKTMFSEADMREAIVKASLSNIDDLIERCDDILRQFNKK